MTHELAAAEMVIDSIREQISLIKTAGITEDNLMSLVVSIAGTIAIYDETRASLHKIDEVG